MTYRLTVRPRGVTPSEHAAQTKLRPAEEAAPAGGAAGPAAAAATAADRAARAERSAAVTGRGDQLAAAGDTE